MSLKKYISFDRKQRRQKQYFPTNEISNRIINTLKHDPMSAAELFNHMHKNDDRVSKHIIKQNLRTLRKEGKIKRQPILGEDMRRIIYFFVGP